ncbi:TetR/AcrR family transcriptional regulator [Novosphingobium sp. 1949]|uniref:TetR/AcrR family transcriptional regulator n=1 Tax=Novosphingobium organovorum TaxID=2930092 RepID=A0ABT0BCU0_9SPHN|nr:TetR/AcrR family transcriptional regulator [Novosphingobium organovorum]MCJ2182769.1 TetR/AcrR family transcriptional regulator [Novosphingobium organovorum]
MAPASADPAADPVAVTSDKISDKAPRTERGRKTRQKLLDAAASEFGERGFHEASITSITQRAGTALGSFYTYFDSKDEIYRALVDHLSSRVREAARESRRSDLEALEAERVALTNFLNFAGTHKEIYRIIDECEFVDPATFRTHYESTAQRIFERLGEGARKGEVRADIEEAHAWAIMGMNVFLGLRYAVWSQERDPAEVAEIANSILRGGLLPRP